MTTLSVQLYSLRHIPDLADQLSLVQAAGLTAVEATSSNYDQAARMADLCHQLGLDVPSGHVGLDRLRGDFDGTVQIARSLGIHTLVLWGLPDAETPTTLDGWRAVGQDLGALAKRLSAQGLRFALHNHDWELQRFEDGQSGLDHLFAGAGGAPLLWQADLAWLARGKADVDATLQTHAKRLVSVHVTDMAPAGQNADEDGWSDLGEGTLPWQRWWPAVEAIGVDLFVLEHDEPSDPARFLTRSAAYARTFYPTL